MSRFKTATDEIYELYKSFMESGFTNDQAFELVSLYIHRTIVEDLINQKAKRTNADILREYANKRKEYQKKEIKEKENVN